MSSNPPDNLHKQRKGACEPEPGNEVDKPITPKPKHGERVAQCPYYSSKPVPVLEDDITPALVKARSHPGIKATPEEVMPRK
jgi:hypothetical protein